MSGFLPLVQADPQHPTHEEEVLENVSEEERPDSDRPRSLGSTEDGGATLLHSTDMLEYPNGSQPLATEGSAIEMVPSPLAANPETPRADGGVAAGDLWPKEVNPRVQVVGPPTKGEERPSPEAGEGPDSGAEVSSRRPFLMPHSGQGSWPAPRGYPPAGAEWPDSEEEEAQGAKRPPCARCTRPNLKATAALSGALLVYPCFLYGAYIFLPFDVPLMPALSTRVIYTLRCGVFTTVPIVMGIIVYSLARCCSACSESLGPGRELVDVHRGFVTDSIHLFVLFYANLIVLSTHLPQEMLKLLPLLAAFFALARLIYWGTSAMSSTFRGFGYGLTFFPIVGLLVANLCYMFVLGPDKMFATSASGSEGQEEASGPRQRFWG
ncbi:transmembrane protein 79-like [Carcharodon carcharias]|uniref:transmembrane protein 79-like n=1 Tax=Carcharodon carcharias TaxID=13397 RepID=UPI001B7DAA04|nr:transmembrane protein 79-like [Carcharodon carcharias]